MSKINEDINSVFDNMTYSELYGFDIWFTILIFVIVIFIAIYFFILNTIKSQKANWEKNKCHPFFMPFASMINTSDGEPLDSDYNYNNFKDCLNQNNQDLTDEVHGSILAIFNGFSKIMTVGSSVSASIMSYTTMLFDTLYQLFLAIYRRIMMIIDSNNTVFASINDFLNHIIGVLTSLYYQLTIVVDSIKLVAPMLAMSFLISVVYPLMIATTSAYVLFGVFFGIWCIPFFGGWAHPVWVTWLVIAILLNILTMFMTILYIAFSTMAEEILERTLNPHSNIEMPSIADPPNQ